MDSELQKVLMSDLAVELEGVTKTFGTQRAVNSLDLENPAGSIYGFIGPMWQVVLSVALLIAGTFVGVVAAARIYRIGILWQGKTPKLNELLKWVIRNPTG